VGAVSVVVVGTATGIAGATRGLLRFITVAK
jgi:hypothetical protein